MASSQSPTFHSSFGVLQNSAANQTFLWNQGKGDISVAIIFPIDSVWLCLFLVVPSPWWWGGGRQLQDARRLNLSKSQGDARQEFWREQSTSENDEISPRRINSAGKGFEYSYEYKTNDMMEIVHWGKITFCLQRILCWKYSLIFLMVSTVIQF